MNNNLKGIMKKEFDKDKNYNEILSNIERVENMKNFKLKYILASTVTFIVLFAVILGISSINNTPNEIIGEKDINEDDSTSKIEIALDINEIKDLEMMSLDVDIEIINISNIPERFEFMNNIKIPSEYKINDSYNIYTKSGINANEYDVLHDYVFNYKKDNTNTIKIAFSEIEKPIRDYYINGGNKVSKIGESEIIISQYNKMYIVSFKYNDIYFDIETVGISQEELVDLLTSIIK